MLVNSNSSGSNNNNLRISLLLDFSIQKSLCPCDYLATLRNLVSKPNDMTILNFFLMYSVESSHQFIMSSGLWEHLFSFARRRNDPFQKSSLNDDQCCWGCGSQLGGKFTTTTTKTNKNHTSILWYYNTGSGFMG